MRHAAEWVYGVLDKLLPGRAFFGVAEEVQGELPTEYAVFSFPSSRLEVMSTLSRHYDQLWIREIAIDLYALTPERITVLERQIIDRMVDATHVAGGQQFVRCDPSGQTADVDMEKDTEGRNVYHGSLMMELWEGTGAEDRSSSSSSSPATSSSASSSSSTSTSTSTSSSQSASSGSSASTASSSSGSTASSSSSSESSASSSSTAATRSSSSSSSTSSYSSASSSSSSDSGP